MESYEDDDDTHFCNKCHSTINGLENYVRHRQSGCRTNEEDKTEVYHCPPSTPNVTYPEILNADAFFSSLELQSSAKSHPRRSADLPRRSGRHEERRKRRRKDKSPEDKDEAKEKLSSLLPPVVTDLDDLGIPSLVGFPEIVPGTSKSTATSASTSSAKQISPGGSASKIETSAYSGKHENQASDQKRHPDESQRIDQDHHHHSVWLEDTILTDLDVNNEAENKEGMQHTNLDRYAEYDYQQEEESEDDSLDVDMPEEDSYSESDDPDTHDPQYPPQSHTGGKWKPGGIAQEEVQLNEDDAELEEAEHHHEHPPPSYTGGKWKPTDSTIQKCDEYESKDVSGQPPPGHTRGKWVPGARADIGTGYWCSPCGRKLASRLVYNRHLLSDLHARRSIQEIDGAVQIPRGAAPLLHPQNLSRRQKILASKRSSESSAAEQEQQHQRRERREQRQRKRLRKREKEILSCEMCHARVRRAQMGKHLLSHYHCRVAGATPSGARARRFLLENMANIVRQCPFQCASCRFYCNTEDTFLRHWRSDAHKDTVSKIGGSFICALCDFWCDDNESVEAHIMKQGHQDVVSMINGSVPIVIRRQRVLTCSTCCRRFRYNVQLRSHAKESGHEVGYSASDEYQSRLGCSVCGQIVRSLISLQRHQLACHKPSENEATEAIDAAVAPSPYFCSFCSLTFRTAREAVLHRRTSSHKETVKSKKSETAATIERTGTSTTMKTSQRTCPHCEESQINLAEHKRHLLQEHSELCHRCPQCGKRFALSQDVTRHTRENRCSGAEDDPDETGRSDRWRCSDCAFASSSEAEFLFHRALHAGRLERPADEASSSAPAVPARYRCPLCERPLAKSTLRDHLRKHTGERPFPCARCRATFARRSAARAHLRECHGRVTATANWRRSGADDRERRYVCSECDAAFHTKHILRQHMLRHAGKRYKCGLPGCPTVLRTETELKNHRKLVHESSSSDRDFQCNDCSYAAKTKVQLVRHQKRHQKADAEDNAKQYSCQYINCSFQTKISSHLKRHIRLHTGKKPYKCRHCTYASNNLENLRKHVLSTNLHPGKMIYQCQSCECEEAFQSNFSKELRAHLLQFHPNEYPTPNDASNYIAAIFDEPEGSETCDK